MFLSREAFWDGTLNPSSTRIAPTASRNILTWPGIEIVAMTRSTVSYFPQMQAARCVYSPWVPSFPLEVAIKEKEA